MVGMKSGAWKGGTAVRMRSSAFCMRGITCMDLWRQRD